MTKKLCKETVKHTERKRSKLAELTGSNDADIESCLIEYSPKVFHYIREHFGYTNKQMMKIMNPASNIKSLISVDESKGKSGSFFMFSDDNHVAIKTIKESEAEALKKFLIKYAEHYRIMRKSLLCKILGLFYFELPGVSPIYFIVMENILRYAKPIRTYDLKGSTHGRKVKKEKPGSESENEDNKDSAPFKDLDFLSEHKKILLNDEDYREFETIICSDTSFLESFSIMDYSLLLCEEEKGQHGTRYTYGIIDYLTKYGFYKRIERAFTIFTNPKKSLQVSVIDPGKYANRFRNFVLGSWKRVSTEKY